MKAWNFAVRNIKEILRDPLGIIFCVIFPVAMIAMFQLFRHYTSDAYWFDIDILMPGIIVFAFAFVMLYMAILVSKDRTTSLLSRLYSSPMKTSDYIIGYGIPGIILGYIQIIICVIASYIVAAATGVSISFGGALLNLLTDFPVIVVMTALGILFGSVLSDKSAPGVASAIITISAVLGGAWMPLETMGSLETVCKFLPWYPATSMGRMAVTGTYDGFALYMITDLAYAVVLSALAVVVFKKMMIKDNK